MVIVFINPIERQKRPISVRAVRFPPRVDILGIKGVSISCNVYVVWAVNEP